MTRRGVQIGLNGQDPVRRYERQRAEAITAALDDPRLLRRFGPRRTGPNNWPRLRLRSGYGRRFDERVVEYPWALAHRPRGRCLDAGAVLNHPEVLSRFGAVVDELHLVTAADREPDHGASLLRADLRALPYPSMHFETVLCLSTLEHVGMDNSVYGGEGRSERPELEADRALAELRRVMAPGGMLLVSVPFGRREDHGWFRQFARADVARLMAGDPDATLDIFAYTALGWRRSTPRRASSARYRDATTEPHPRDGAVAARAVACLCLRNRCPGRAGMLAPDTDWPSPPP